MPLRSWIVTILSLLWLTGPGMAQTSDGIQVSVPSITLATGDHVQASVRITCPMATCATVDLTLQYDPTLIALDSVSWGSFLGIDAQDVLTISYAHDAQSGVLRVAYITLPTAATIPQAAGDLLILDIRGLTPGSGEIIVTEVIAGSFDGLQIEPVSGQTGTVTIVAPPPIFAACPGDVDGDGVVSTSDLNQLLLAFTPTGTGNLDADVNADGIVDILDVIIINRHLGLPIEECGS